MCTLTRESFAEGKVMEMGIENTVKNVAEVSPCNFYKILKISSNQFKSPRKPGNIGCSVQQVSALNNMKHFRGFYIWALDFGCNGKVFWGKMKFRRWKFSQNPFHTWVKFTSGFCNKTTDKIEDLQIAGKKQIIYYKAVQVDVKMKIQEEKSSWWQENISTSLSTWNYLQYL